MAATQPTLPQPPRKRGRRRRLILAGLLVLAVAAYFIQPAAAAWWIGRTLRHTARQAGLSLVARTVEADLLAGKIHLGDVVVTDELVAGRKIRAAAVDVRFSLFRALFQKKQAPVTELRFERVTTRWLWKPGSDREAKWVPGRDWMRWFPESIHGTGLDTALEWTGGRLETNGLECSFQKGAPGTVAIPKLTVRNGTWQQSFSNLNGTTALKDNALYVGGIELARDMQLNRGMFDFSDLEKARITSALEFSSFGGELRIDTQFDMRKSPLFLDLAGEFWNLSVARLGAFTGNTRLASGTIHDGRITFRGYPGDVQGAAIAVRLNATDFQWRERQWQSLVFSALLLNNRLEIPQFSLVQDRNRIEIDGGMDLPDSWTRLPEQFQLTVRAKIDDLAQAASLLVPGQKMVGGEALFAGKIGRKDGQLSGKLDMRAGPLTIRDLTIDRVRGDLDLHGLEISASNLVLARRDDLATGWATVDLGAARRYSGQFEMAAKNIADYQALLPAFLSQYAVAGGAKIWWSGDGTQEAHSGAFKLDLDQFLRSRAPETVPLDITSHGSYSPGGITLNHLRVARPETSVEGMVIVRPDSLELRDLQGRGKNSATVSANLALPLNILAALQKPSWAALLESASPCAGRLTAHKISLADFFELAGRRSSARGSASCDITLSGLLENLTAQGTLSLSDFVMPHREVTYRIPEVSGQFSVAEQRMKIEGRLVAAPGGSAQISWETGLHTGRDFLARFEPLDGDAAWSGSFALKDFPVEFLHPWWPEGRVLGAAIDGSLQLTGTPKTSIWSGNCEITQGRWTPTFLPMPVKHLQGKVAFSNSQWNWTGMTGEYRGGKFTCEGRTGPHPDADLALNWEFKGLQLPDDDGWQATVNGSGQLTGPAGQRTLAGNWTLGKTAVGGGHLAIGAGTAPSEFTLPWLPAAWELALTVRSEAPFEVPGPLTRWELRPDLRLTGSARHPIFQGTVAMRETVSPAPREGVLIFLSTPFEEGSFAGNPPGETGSFPMVEEPGDLHPRWMPDFAP